MADFSLKESAPFDGCDLPIDLGAARLEPVAMGAIIEVMPFQGQAMAVTAAMKSLFGAALPKVGETLKTDSAEVFWYGQGQWMVCGADSAALTSELDGLAALVDQSSAYATLYLTGEDHHAVLARLCPLDFDQLKPGQVARSDFAHISATFIPDENGMRILLPRSFARAGYESVVDVMKSIAAQKLL